MGNIRLYGSTSGYTELAPPAVAPDGVLSLPSGVGTLLTAEGGKVLQVVRATDVTQRTTTSTSFVDASLSVTITPQKSDSAIILMAVFSASTQTSTSGDHRVSYQITDSSNNGVSGAQLLLSGNENYSISGTAQTDRPTTLIGYATPATTSAVTYKLRFNVASSNTTNRIRNELNTGQLYAIEVSA